MQKQLNINIKNVCFGNQKPLSIIAGPCALESKDHAFDVCGKLKDYSEELNIGFVYKTSFDKANRTSMKSARGIGMDKAITIFNDLKKEFDVPIITDVHENYQCEAISKVVDIIQIPAFLCRQTDLLISAAKTNKPVMVKKGQFLAPWDMKNVADKLENAGCRKIMLCERGVSFGYNTLVSDMRSLPILKRIGWPVIFDATHSVQQPGGHGTSSGGQSEFVEVLAKAAVAIGVAGVFLETHEKPDQAPSDGPNMIPLSNFKILIEQLLSFDNLAKNK